MPRLVEQTNAEYSKTIGISWVLYYDTEVNASMLFALCRSATVHEEIYGIR